MTLKDYFLRFASHFDHYGRCGRCKISWKYRENQLVKYDPRGGWAFPLCTQCFREVDPIVATRYFKRLWVEQWDRPVDEDAREAFRTFLSHAAQIRREEGDLTFGQQNELRGWANV